jgi:16S rRNA C967 or C1407 C5-methylase (RsmB/RsmF family)
MANKNSPSGPSAFDGWYHDMLGGRWPELRNACAAPNRHFELSAGLRKPYYLDPASVLASLCLDITPGQSVLDLCAAPGGKTLVIALRLFGLVPADVRLADLGRPAGDTAGEDAAAYPDSSQVTAIPATESDDSSIVVNGSRLVANELSANRRGRLRQVLSGHLPAQAAHIRSTGFDAAGWGQHERDSYDRILLDVPCSSERHLIQDPSYLREWSPKRSRQLAQQAYAMGLSAGQALKAGGRLLYCTCALSELENDGNVERILERSRSQSGRYGYRLEALTGEARDLEALMPGVRADLSGLAEKTRLGLRVWPDQGGYGPLYFSLMHKVAT